MLPWSLASRQHSKFISCKPVRRLLQTNGASGSRLSSSTIPIRFGVFRTVRKHMLTQNWQKLHLTGPQLKASLPPKNLCRGYCSVNFGIVKFAALHWMRCQSFRTSLDRMTESHCNSPGKYDRNCACPKDSWYSTSDSWRKEGCQSMDRHPANVCQNGCYRLASLWFWWYAKSSAWWTFETSWKYFTLMFALGAGHSDADSTAGHAICDNSLGHHQNCLYNMRKVPYILSCWAYMTHTTCNCTILYIVDPPGVSPSVSCLVPCVGFLASRQQKKSPDLTWSNETFLASQNKMLPFRSIRRQLYTTINEYHLLLQRAQKASRALLEHRKARCDSSEKARLQYTSARCWNTPLMQAVPQWGAARPHPSCRYSIVFDGLCKTRFD